MDLRTQLERAIPHGPEQPPAETRVVAGRAALRRRRTALAAGVAAVVVAVAVPVVVAAGGTAGPGADVSPAAPPSAIPSATPSASSKPQRARDIGPWLKGDPPARVDVLTGTLEIRDGAVVHERRNDVYPGKDTHSVALDLSFRGERYWMVLEWDRGGGGETSSGPDDDLFDSFDDFVAVRRGAEEVARHRRGADPGQGHRAHGHRPAVRLRRHGRDPRAAAVT